MNLQENKQDYIFLLKILIKYINKYKKALIVVSGLILLGRFISTLIVPYIIKSIINSINLKEKNIYIYLTFILCYIISYIFLMIVYNVSEYVRIHFVGKIGFLECFIDFVKKLNEHSYSFFVNHPNGEIKTNIEALSNGVERLIMIIFIDIVPYIVILMIYIFYLLRYNIYFSLFILFWSIFFSYFTIFLIKNVMDAFKETGKDRANIGSALSDIINNIINIKIFSTEKHEINFLKKLSIKFFRTRMGANKKYIFEDVIKSCADLLFNALLLFILILSFLKNKINISDFFFIFYSMQSINNLNIYFTQALGSFISTYAEVSSNLKVLFDEDEIVDKKDAKTLKVNNGSIIFKDLYFKYNKK